MLPRAAGFDLPHGAAGQSVMIGANVLASESRIQDL
jgi:hypothetical protein